MATINPQQDQINMLVRRSQTTIFRLRTGHCGLKNIQREWVLLTQPTANVVRRPGRTPDHILQICPHHETASQTFLPTDTIARSRG